MKGQIMVNAHETHAELISKLKDSAQADLYFTAILEQCKNLDAKEVLW